MDTQIDHFMYAVASLDEGMQWAQDTFGVAAVYGGEHVGLGTRNALLSLGDTYLEIIAPDPAQSLQGNMGERFSRLSGGGLVTWCARGNLAEIAKTLEAGGVATVGPNRTERQTQEGDLLVWELLFPTGSAHGPRLPFFIDWLECAHPSKTNPVAGTFKSIVLTVPDPDDLQRTLSSIGLNLTVSEGDPAISIEIETTNGAVSLASTDETRQLSMR